MGFSKSSHVESFCNTGKGTNAVNSLKPQSAEELGLSQRLQAIEKRSFSQQEFYSGSLAASGRGGETCYSHFQAGEAEERSWALTSMRSHRCLCQPGNRAWDATAAPGSWALTNNAHLLHTTPGDSGELEIFMYGGLICHPSQTGKTHQTQHIWPLVTFTFVTGTISRGGSRTPISLGY